MTKLLLFVTFFLALTTIKAQQSAVADTAVFDRIIKSVESYRIDTTTPPADAITKTIIELRELRGGFNINEAISFKIAEEAGKKNISEAEADKQRQYFTQGNGKRWLDNAVIWIYRSQFTHKQLKGLVKFYRSDAGQKMAEVFPIIMVQTLTAAEQVKGMQQDIGKLR